MQSCAVSCFPFLIPFYPLEFVRLDRIRGGGLKAQYILPCILAGYLGKQKHSRKILPQGKSAF